MEKVIKKTFVRILAVAVALCAAAVGMMAGTALVNDRSDLMASLKERREDFEVIPNFADDIYDTTIHRKLEDFLDSPQAISFAYATKDYPPNQPGINRIREDLAVFCAHTDYVSNAFLYNVSSNLYASSLPRFNAIADAAYDEPIRELIYAYNSGKEIRQRLASSNGHPTFLFAYNDGLFLSKEVITISGQSICTLFAELDTGSLIRALNSLAAGRTVSINVYDEYDNLLFTTAEDAPTLSRSDLLRLADNADGVDMANGGGTVSISLPGLSRGNIASYWMTAISIACAIHRISITACS